MSDAPDRDLLAADYVLGTLEGAERDEAAALLARDPDFARAVAAWERRLAPLAALVAEAPPPPALWDRIAASLPAPTASALPSRSAPRVAARIPRARLGPRFWQGTTIGALALAASLVVVMLLRPAPPSGQPSGELSGQPGGPPMGGMALAVLAPRAGGPALVAFAARPGEVLIRPVGALAPVPAGREMELWFLPQGAHRPRPMGALPAEGRVVRRALAPGTQIMVSLEPAGGSPTGLPTGPVLFAGTLERL